MLRFVSLSSFLLLWTRCWTLLLERANPLELLGSSDGNIVRNGRFFGYFWKNLIEKMASHLLSVVNRPADQKSLNQTLRFWIPNGETACWLLSLTLSQTPPNRTQNTQFRGKQRWLNFVLLCHLVDWLIVFLQSVWHARSFFWSWKFRVPTLVAVAKLRSMWGDVVECCWVLSNVVDMKCCRQPANLNWNAMHKNMPMQATHMDDQIINDLNWRWLQYERLGWLIGNTPLLRRPCQPMAVGHSILRGVPGYEVGPLLGRQTSIVTFVNDSITARNTAKLFALLKLTGKVTNRRLIVL